MTEAFFSCDGVRKQFGGLVAVNNVSFKLERGATLGIGGPNGAGKTTLFDLISGIQQPTSGKVVFEGRDVTGRSAEELCHAGIARTFQLNAGFDTLTVLENVEVAAYFGRQEVRMPSFRLDSATRDRAMAALENVGMAKKRDQIVRDLPVLDRKLLMLAGALVTEPQLLLMDEPVGGLTPHEIDQFAEILTANRGSEISIIVIEHVMRFLLAMSDRVMILHHGAVLFEGHKSDMLKDERVVQAYLGSNASRLLRQTAIEKELLA